MGRIWRDAAGNEFRYLEHPNYLRHFRKGEFGTIKWMVEVDEPREFVASGIANSLVEARQMAEAAVENHKQSG